MENEHNITQWRGRDLEDKLCMLALMSEDQNIKTQKFYIEKQDGVYEVFRVKYNAEIKRVFVKFSDGDRPTWKKIKGCLNNLGNQHKTFLRKKLGSHRKSSFKTTQFKVSVMLLLEVAQSVILTSSIASRNEAELAIQAALDEEASTADIDDLMMFLACSRDETDKSKKARRKAFERLMLRKTSRQMRAVLRQGYFTNNSKTRLRETISSYSRTPNNYLKDAVKTLSKILYKDEFFDQRNKEAFKIILSVFDSITVFDSING